MADPRDVLPHHRGSYRCGWEENCQATELFTAWIRDIQTGRAKAVWGCADHLGKEVEAILYHMRAEPPDDL